MSLKQDLSWINNYIRMLFHACKTLMFNLEVAHEMT